MSNTLFALLGSLAPVQGFLQKFSAAAPFPGRSGSSRATLLVDLPAVPVPEPACAAKARTGTRARSRGSMPLRVVRVMEAGQAEAGQAAHGGRMMISGRMADVCAELDRMAEREAAPHLRR